MTDVLPGFEAGDRTERVERRVIINPDVPKARWVIDVPQGADARRIAGEFVVPTATESRLVVTYTGPWTRGGEAS